MSTKPTFEIELELHVYPVLHLARMAVVLERMLADIDVARRIHPELDERLKSHGCITDYGCDIADQVDTAMLGAVDLLKAHQDGPVFVVAPKGGAA
ncbi:MAG: hypothetical protein Q8S32_13145 [Burkholderiaceae bacterium]|nr:hypothetical protein [Burkholderiaceae bacterium]